jgi:hypothetical protein
LWSWYCLSFVLFIVVMVLYVIRPFYCGHCLVCPSSFFLRSLHCLSFVLFIVVIALSIPWPQLKGRRTDNTMTTINRTKDRQCNDHNKKDEGQGHCIVCPSSYLLWSLYCLFFVLLIVVMVLSVLRPFHCGHCIVCPSSFLLWSLHCLSIVLFIVVIALSNAMTTIKRTKDRPCNDRNKKDEGQTRQWPQ